MLGFAIVLQVAVVSLCALWPIRHDLILLSTLPGWRELYSISESNLDVWLLSCLVCLGNIACLASIADTTQRRYPRRVLPRYKLMQFMTALLALVAEVYAPICKRTACARRFFPTYIFDNWHAVTAAREGCCCCIVGGGDCLPWTAHRPMWPLGDVPSNMLFYCRNCCSVLFRRDPHCRYLLPCTYCKQVCIHAHDLQLYEPCVRFFSGHLLCIQG